MRHRRITHHSPHQIHLPMMPGADAFTAPSQEVQVDVGFRLPKELAAVLPADQFEQLDVPRWAARCGGREDAHQLAQHEVAAEDLQGCVEQLDLALVLSTGRLSRAGDQRAIFFATDKLILDMQETPLKENVAPSNTIRTLNRDVAEAKCHIVGVHSGIIIQEISVFLRWRSSRRRLCRKMLANMFGVQFR